MIIGVAFNALRCAGCDAERAVRDHQRGDGGIVANEVRIADEIHADLRFRVRELVFEHEPIRPEPRYVQPSPVDTGRLSKRPPYSRLATGYQTIDATNEWSGTLARIRTLRALPYRPRMGIEKGWI
jgi:hypothetical protein